MSEAYAAAKGGILSMVRGLAVELARHGITANTIIPGWIDTDMTSRRVGDPKFEDRVMRRVPLRRWGTLKTSLGLLCIWQVMLPNIKRVRNLWLMVDTLVFNIGFKNLCRYPLVYLNSVAV